MNRKILPARIHQALEASATVLVPTSQRQAALRAAWAEWQRDTGKVLWTTPRVLTFTQFCEGLLAEQWAAANLPDRLLPAGAEWASLRELRRDAGGNAEARALLTAIRAISDWRIPATHSALGASPEAQLLHDSLQALERLRLDRKPLRSWLETLDRPDGALLAVGFSSLPASHLETLRRLGAEFVDEPVTDARAPVSIATADNDEHELDLIASWCRTQIERDPGCHLLIVDSKLRQRRRLYERLLSQTLSPSRWLSSESRDASRTFAIEGGKPLKDFPIIGHALSGLRLLTGRLRFDEIVHWLRMPFADRADLFANVAVEDALRTGRKLEYAAEEFAAFLERVDGATAHALAGRLRLAVSTLSGEARLPAEWAPRILKALRQLGWPGERALRSDEQQTVARWHGLLDEYSALGAWFPRASASDAVAALADLAGERNFDAASVAAPVTLTESHDDPIVRYDGIWVAGLDAAQWPPPPRPDVFIPLRLQVAAGIPSASAAGQARVARASLDAWRAASDRLICSWARLEGDAHRSPSPLLTRLADQTVYEPQGTCVALAEVLHRPDLENVDDVDGVRVNIALPVAGGVTPLALQSECGFHAYAQMRLDARELESPAPGIDARERGKLLHKALELVWLKLERHFNLTATDAQVLRPTIADSVAAAVVHVYRGYVPPELKDAVDRETLRLEQLIEKLLAVERERAPFLVDTVEARREVSIAGGQFEFRIDRIDFLEDGGYAILDYKSGEPRALRWKQDSIRDPQLLAYLLAERGRNVQALVNVSLTSGNARFTGKSARKGVFPGVNGMPGMNPSKIPREQIEAAWQSELDRWLAGLHQIAAAYLAGHAPVQPAADVCRHCHLTLLCRRVELAAADVEARDDEHD